MNLGIRGSMIIAESFSKMAMIGLLAPKTLGFVSPAVILKPAGVARIATRCLSMMGDGEKVGFIGEHMGSVSRNKDISFACTLLHRPFVSCISVVLV